MKPVLQHIYKCLLLSGIYLMSLPSIGFSYGVIGMCHNPGGPLDHPVGVSSKMQCSKATDPQAEELPTLCSGDLFQYQIIEPGINYWEWSLSPEWAIPVTQNTGPNGFLIISQLYNPTNLPVEITGVFVGYKIGTPDVLVKKINFWVRPRLACAIDQHISLDVSNDDPVRVKIAMPVGHFTDHPIENRTSVYTQSALKIYPMPAMNRTMIEWGQSVEMPMKLFVFNSEGTKVSEYEISDHIKYSKEIDVSQYEAGMYIILLIYKNQIHTGQLIKI